LAFEKANLTFGKANLAFRKPNLAFPRPNLAFLFHELCLAGMLLHNPHPCPERGGLCGVWLELRSQRRGDFRKVIGVEFGESQGIELGI
jgi:hypothetical protein